MCIITGQSVSPSEHSATSLGLWRRGNKQGNVKDSVERTEQFASSCTEGVSSEELSLNLNNRFHRVDGCRDSLMRSSQVDSEMSLPLGKSSNWENIYRDRIGNERFAGKWPQLALRSQFHFNDVVFVTLAIFLKKNCPCCVHSRYLTE